MADFLPHREADLLAWSEYVNTLVNATPASFGLTEGQAIDCAALHTTIAPAFAVTKGPNRGPAATQTKAVYVGKALALAA